jgi:hypothetical protein
MLKGWLHTAREQAPTPYFSINSISSLSSLLGRDSKLLLSCLNVRLLGDIIWLIDYR